MIVTGLDALRYLTIFISCMVFGLCATVLYYYVRFGRKEILPVEEPHVLMISVSYIGAITVGVANVIDDILRGSEFQWYSSPLLLISTSVAGYGLLRLIQYERARKGK